MEPALDRYAHLLLDWNRRINLTGARSLPEVMAHIEDAIQLLALSWLDVRDVIDIGSGGGLPSIPLAVRLPEVRFTLLEANTRKVAFLQHVAGVLALSNVAVAGGRAETLGHDLRFRERFDRAVSRAAARPAVLLELALPFVRVGGDLVAEVGPVDPDGLVVAARLLGGDAPRLEPALDGRSFLVVSKVSPTPPEYPRRPGMPNRRPLRDFRAPAALDG